MEFLEISGTARIDAKKLDEAYCRLVQRIQDIHFEDGGVMLVTHDDDELTIEGSGEVMDVFSVNELLRQLNDYLADDAYMTINRSRWECFVCLNIMHDVSFQGGELMLAEA